MASWYTENVYKSETCIPDENIQSLMMVLSPCFRLQSNRKHNETRFLMTFYGMNYLNVKISEMR